MRRSANSTLTARKQGSRESVNEFASAIQRLVFRSFPFHFISFKKYGEVALQPWLILKGPLILHVVKVKSKILQRYIYIC